MLGRSNKAERLAGILPQCNCFAWLHGNTSTAPPVINLAWTFLERGVKLYLVDWWCYRSSGVMFGTFICFASCPTMATDIKRKTNRRHIWLPGAKLCSICQISGTVNVKLAPTFCCVEVEDGYICCFVQHDTLHISLSYDKHITIYAFLLNMED